MDFNDQLELVKDYLEEAQEFVEHYEGLLMQLEQKLGGPPGEAMLLEILGVLHTFKGNSGMMGYSHLQKYAHLLEDLFKGLQSGAQVFDPEVVEFTLTSVNHVRDGLGQVSLTEASDPDLTAPLQEIEQFLSRGQTGGATEKSKGRGKEKTMSAAAAPDPSAVSAPAAGRLDFNPFQKRSNVLKVDFERLDQLLNLMGELVIHRTRLGRIEAMFTETYGEKGLALDLADASEQIGKVATELHEAIMRVRMLPIKTVFMRFPRLVRDLARERGKVIQIQFEGEDTELDKTVIDEIGEPLLHLIRNAIDHGIETPEEREEAGKSGEGGILVRAYQESSHIIITVEDDGRGINEDKLRDKAVSMGLITREMTDINLTDLIFLPGLSTAQAVSEVSGRGLGMDVVKKSLAKINGIIEVETEKNVGTRFTIKLPLTLAIISALMVESSGEQFAIPLSSVLESMRVAKADIHEVNNREVTNIRGAIVPLARLHDLYNLPHSTNGATPYTVIVQSSFGRMGIIVDHLLGQQEIVIKALDDYLGNAAGVAGATILGDGKVVLIVDVLELMEKHRNIDYQEIAKTMEVQHAQ